MLHALINKTLRISRSLFIVQSSLYAWLPPPDGPGSVHVGAPTVSGVSGLAGFDGNPSINVGETHDVVFAEVLAALYFDHHQVDHPRVDQPVLFARLDKGRLIGVEHELVVAVGDLRHAADHDPVFAAMVVHLQRQRSVGLDHDALDLEALAFLEHGVGAPWTGYGAVQAIGVVALALEFLGDQPDVLAAFAVGDQQGVRRVDDDQVLEPDAAHQALGRIDVAVADVMQYGLAVALVALGIGRCQFTHRLPRTDIAPAELAGHHRDFARAFHQCVVDGNVRRPGQALAIQFQLKFLAAFAAVAEGQTLGHGVEDVRGVFAQFAQHGVGPQAEHAGVPQVPAAIEVLLRRLRIGFLDEARDLERLVAQGLAFLDIAEAGLGLGRHQAEGHQPALLGQESGTVDRLGEGVQILDQMIGRQHQQLRVVTVEPGHMQGRRGDGRGRIATKGFEDEVQRRVALVHLAVVIQGTEEHLAVGHRQYPLDTGQFGGPAKGLLQQAFAVGQAHEGFWHGLAGDRPQAGAGATGDDAGNEYAHSEGLAGHEHCRDSAEQDVEVEPDRPVFDVLQIELDTFFDFFQGVGFATVAIDLGESGDAWLDPMTRGVLLDGFLEQDARRLGGRGVGARADHRHAADEDIEQLWQLVEAGPADKTSDPGDSRIAAGGLCFGVGIALVLMHRAELEDFDQAVVVAVALLAKQHRARRVDFDRQGRQQHERRQEDQREARQDHVLQALEHRRPAAQGHLGRVEHRQVGDFGDAVVGMPEGNHVRHQQHVDRQAAQFANDVVHAVFRRPGQGDQDLGDFFLADQAFQVAGVAQQWQVDQGLGQAADAVVDKTDDSGADVLVLGQVFGQALAVFSGPEDDRVLKEKAPLHQLLEQGQQYQAFDTEQYQAGYKPDKQFGVGQEVEQGQAMVHE